MHLLFALTVVLMNIQNASLKRFKCKKQPLTSWEKNHLSSFKATVEKIKTLETERKNLLIEIEELKRMADAKAKALESEISTLRDEVKSLRVLLGGEEPETDSNLRKSGFKK
jgi:uncharacterized protein YlxW (UPF0749 family)